MLREKKGDRARKREKYLKEKMIGLIERVE